MAPTIAMYICKRIVALPLRLDVADFDPVDARILSDLLSWVWPSLPVLEWPSCFTGCTVVSGGAAIESFLGYQTDLSRPQNIERPAFLGPLMEERDSGLGDPHVDVDE
jgi:hypothetical protein